MNHPTETMTARQAYARLRLAVAKKPAALQLSEKLMSFHKAGMYDQCPDGIYTRIPLTISTQLTGYNFSIKE